MNSTGPARSFQATSIRESYRIPHCIRVARCTLSIACPVSVTVMCNAAFTNESASRVMPSDFPNRPFRSGYGLDVQINCYGSGSPAIILESGFGGALGGPIRKNKDFFFGDYQGCTIRNLHRVRRVYPRYLESGNPFDGKSGTLP